MTSATKTTVLITGANSGLGFSTCCRLMDEFLATRPGTPTLTIIFTTRSSRKRDETLAALRTHLARTVRTVYGDSQKTASIRALQTGRVELRGELMDLCDLGSVKRLARGLVAEGARVDVLICNAGIGGWSGLNWYQAIGGLFFDIFEATTFPRYKLGQVGRVVPRQIKRTLEGDKEGQEKALDVGPGEPPLGETFTANVFGHYMLGSWLTESMKRKDGESPSRIVWVSSIEAFDKYLNLDDLQALKTGESYESSKRLTDLLVLSSELPSTQTHLRGYFRSSRGSGKDSPTTKDTNEGVVVDVQDTVGPKMYVTHPGVCVTSISGIHWIMVYFNVMALYLVRWLGSPWHPISSYLGAVPTTWISLVADEVLEKLEGEEGKGKWGAATDRAGNERVVRTEVDGWGWGGRPGETPDGTWRLEARKGTNKVVTEEEREEFEVKGAKVWQEMEALRKQWEDILQDE